MHNQTALSAHQAHRGTISRTINKTTQTARTGLQRILLAGLMSLTGCASMAPTAIDLAALTKQVADTERAFADTMARRDHIAFAQFLADDAIFVSGDDHLRGKAAIVAAWKPLYAATQAPFSWEPDYVEVQDSGLLALSNGPVRDPSGKIVAQFSTIWRQEAPGVWRVIFDKGNPVCEPPAQ